MHVLFVLVVFRWLCFVLNRVFAALGCGFFDQPWAARVPRALKRFEGFNAG